MADDLTKLRERLALAHKEVGEIAAQGAHRRWRMSIPAQPDRDSDLLISRALGDADKLAAEVERLRAGEDPTPADEGTERTPAQFLYRLHQMTGGERLAKLAALWEAVGAGERCFLHGHDGIRDELHAAHQTLARLYALDVTLTDERAADGITPAKMCAYLAAEGWQLHRGVDDRSWWRRGDAELLVPFAEDYVDYRRRVLDLIGDLAKVEKRSPLAVMLDMVHEDVAEDEALTTLLDELEDTP